jgi:hypothetical protein
MGAGVLAGLAGTVCLDAVNYLKYRRSAGTDDPISWEFAPIESWEKAPAPGQVAKRLIEGFTQREIPDRAAFLISTVAHWGYGAAAGAAYGVVAGSLPTPRARYGVAFGAAVFGNDYVAMPIAGLYKPIWRYSLKVLGVDLGAHLAYGVGTGIAFKTLSRGITAAARCGTGVGRLLVRRSASA